MSRRRKGVSVAIGLAPGCTGQKPEVASTGVPPATTFNQQAHFETEGIPVNAAKESPQTTTDKSLDNMREATAELVASPAEITRLIEAVRESQRKQAELEARLEKAETNRFKPEIPDDAPGAHVTYEKAMKVLKAEPNPFRIYAVMQHEADVHCDFKRCISLIHDKRVSPNSDERSPFVMIEFDMPEHMVGTDLPTKKVIMADLLAHPEVKITEEQARQLQAKGFDYYKAKDGYYSIDEIIEAWKALPVLSRRDFLSEAHFQRIMLREYEARRAQMESQRELRSIVNDANVSDVDIITGSIFETPAELVGAGA